MIESKTYIAVPPGATIKEQLEVKGMSQKEFAARMGLSEKHVSRLINGEVLLTQDVAIRLEMVLGLSAGFWNKLEAIYRENITRAERENAEEGEKEIARQIPYFQMAKLGWVPEEKAIEAKVVNLRKFFEVSSLSSIGNEQITRVACRRLSVTDKGDLAVLAWIQQARRVSRNQETPKYNHSRLLSVIPDVRKSTDTPASEFCPRIRELLGECGVALVFLPHLEGSYLHGATFNAGNRVVIGMTVRGKYSDKFWFSLFHELGHLALGHLDKKNGTDEEDELAADRWGSDTLIPPDHFHSFAERKFFTGDSVNDFAYEEGIAPGIVVGRLQHEGLIPYNKLNSLKKKYVIV